VMRSRVWPAAAVGLGVLLLSSNAYAYLDPGTGSLLFQAFAALVLSAMVTFRAWVGALKRAFRRMCGGKPATALPRDASGGD